MNPAIQNELPFQRIESDDVRIEVLVRMLAGRDWTKAQKITELHYLETGHEWHERTIRDLAAESRGRIGSGQRGYKLVREMTEEEKNHNRNWLKSQADKMNRRADEIETVWLKAHPIEMNTAECGVRNTGASAPCVPA